MYENVSTTPDDLLLWFHHVNYTHRLHSGKTVIQHFYDQRYFGRQTVQTFVPSWEALKGKIDEERFGHILFRLQYQAGHADVWRDAINSFTSISRASRTRTTGSGGTAGATRPRP